MNEPEDDPLRRDPHARINDLEHALTELVVRATDGDPNLHAYVVALAAAAGVNHTHRG